METLRDIDQQQVTGSQRYYVSILLPNSRDRKALIEHILKDLAKIPFAVEIRTPEQLIEQKLAAYLQGTLRGDMIYRGMSLDLWVEICGRKPAELYIEELTDEVVMLNFEFKGSDGDPPLWNSDGDFVQGNVHHYRGFLRALNRIYPVLIGTIGLDLTAFDILCLDGGESFSLAGKLTLEQLARALPDPYSDYDYDFAIINPAASGGHAPFIYAQHYFRQEIDLDGAAEEQCYRDLKRVEDIILNAGKAEKAYDRMYESKRPKDDRDDALLLLSKAIGQATDLGLEQVAASLKERYEHINAVFNAQFRYV